MFLLGLFFFMPFPAQAWNPDYSYNLPLQRRMCVKRTGTHKLKFYSITMDQDCPKGSSRYVVVFGRNPPGSIALLASTTSQKFYPPLTLEWPPEPKLRNNKLWHFTCVELGEKQLLDSKVQLYQYKGEITAEGKKECVEVEKRALQYCQETLKGKTLLESCPIPWGN